MKKNRQHVSFTIEVVAGQRLVVERLGIDAHEVVDGVEQRIRSNILDERRRKFGNVACGGKPVTPSEENPSCDLSLTYRTAEATSSESDLLPARIEGICGGCTSQRCPGQDIISASVGRAFATAIYLPSARETSQTDEAISIAS